MHELTDIKAIPVGLSGGVVAIGNFDGVHRGHKRILAEVMALAQRHAAPAGVMIFEPHPREFFRPDQPMFRITPHREKLRIFAELGLDFAVVVPFDAAFSGLSAKAFESDVLAGSLAVRHIVVGHDFQYGKSRGGTVDALVEAGRSFGFAVTTIAAQAADGAIISSSRIRDLLTAGKVAAAADLLGHWWRVNGTVTGGAKRGTGLGFPTANFSLDHRQLPAHGIYASYAVIDGVRHAAASYLGTRPTFDNGAPVMESFLFDFDGDLYGREIGIEFLEHLRGDQGFASVEALVAQMEVDCRAARDVIAGLRRDDPRGRLTLPNLAER